tara:strand:- start:411 stop:587 length:177 start_codon:yes stop_codon:yes gene_type:complete
MNKFTRLKDSHQNNDSKDKNKKDKETHHKSEKILCNHCRRTASNGIRCLGICVADNDY